MSIWHGSGWYGFIEAILTYVTVYLEMNSIFEYATALSVDENVMEGMFRGHLNEPISQTSMNRPEFFFIYEIFCQYLKFSDKE